MPPRVAASPPGASAPGGLDDGTGADNDRSESKDQIMPDVDEVRSLASMAAAALEHLEFTVERETDSRLKFKKVWRLGNVRGYSTDGAFFAAIESVGGRRARSLDEADIIVIGNFMENPRQRYARFTFDEEVKVATANAAANRKDTELMNGDECIMMLETSGVKVPAVNVCAKLLRGPANEKRKAPNANEAGSFADR